MKAGVFLQKFVFYFSAFCSSTRSILIFLYFICLEKIFLQYVGFVLEETTFLVKVQKCLLQKEKYI